MYTLLEKADAERKREKKDTGKKTRKNRSGEKYNLKKKKKKSKPKGIVKPRPAARFQSKRKIQDMTNRQVSRQERQPPSFKDWQTGGQRGEKDCLLENRQDKKDKKKKTVTAPSTCPPTLYAINFPYPGVLAKNLPS